MRCPFGVGMAVRMRQAVELFEMACHAERSVVSG
jgi:hypothetical protein